MNILDATRKELIPKIKTLSTPFSLAVEYINKIMIMMVTISRKATEELSGLFPVKNIEKLLTECKNELDESISFRYIQDAAQYQLPDLCDYGVNYWPVFVNLEAVTGGNQNNRASELSRQNIDLLPITNTADLARLISYIESLQKSPLKSTVMVLTLVVETIENLIFSLSTQLLDENLSVDILSVETLVNMYRLWNRELLQLLDEAESPETRSGLRVELLSKEMLVMWVGFALVNKTLKKRIPFLDQYGVALRWKNVSLLVVSKKNALKAALAVSQYIRTNSREDNRLFDLSGTQETTLKFALHFARESAEFETLWEEEKQAADRRENSQWEAIQRKKKEVERLERILKDSEKELEDLKSRKDACDLFSNRYNQGSQKLTRQKILTSEIRLKRNTVGLFCAILTHLFVFALLKKYRTLELRTFSSTTLQSPILEFQIPS